MSIHAKRNFASMAEDPIGMKIDAAWPRDLAQKRPRRRATTATAEGRDPDSDSGSEAFVADPPPPTLPTMLQPEVAAALRTNSVTSISYGGKAAIAALGAEHKKRNRSQRKVRQLTARECLVLIISVCGHNSLAYTPGSDPDSVFHAKATLPMLGITAGDFVHDFLRGLGDGDTVAVCNHLRLLLAGKAAFGSLIAILTAQKREALNDAVHSPTLEEVEDLLEHVAQAGHAEAAPSQPSPAATATARAVNNVQTFVSILKHLIAPFQAGGAKALRKHDSIRGPAIEHWAKTGLGRRLVGKAATWAGGFLATKRTEIFETAVKDGIVAGGPEVQAVEARMQDKMEAKFAVERQG